MSVGDQFLDEILECGVVVSGETEVLLGGEHHVFHVFHLCGRTGQTDLFGIGIDICGTPFGELQIRTLVNDFFQVVAQFLFFAG